MNSTDVKTFLANLERRTLQHGNVVVSRKELMTLLKIGLTDPPHWLRSKQEKMITIRPATMRHYLERAELGIASEIAKVLTQ